MKPSSICDFTPHLDTLNRWKRKEQCTETHTKKKTHRERRRTREKERKENKLSKGIFSIILRRKRGRWIQIDRLKEKNKARESLKGCQ